MIVYFTRHGESVANVADREMQPEPGDADRLSERGWEQARGLGKRLQGEGIEAILASPFGRAQETAQGIGEVLGLTHETDDDLFEVRQSDAYRAASPNYEGTGHVSWMPANPPEHAEPGAESFSAILNTVRRGLAERHLANDRYSMTEVANLLGFAAPSAFSRWFQQQFDVSPTEWRATSSPASSEARA